MTKKPMPNLEANRFVMPRRTFRIIMAATAAVLALVVWVISLLHPLPPNTITMATGPEGTAYATWGKRYKILLAKQGITVNLVPTAGGVENLNQLMDPKAGVQVGFVEGGIATETDETQLLSLGTVGIEPLWFFSHKITNDRGLFSLRGLRVSVGPEGSDSRAVVDELMKRNAMEEGAFQKLALPPETTEEDLLSGRIDAAILVNSWASPVVRKLAASTKIDLANFARADAYTAFFPSLSKVVLPAGAANLEEDLPSRSVTLLATKASLIVRGDLHPALQYLLLEAASQVHGRNGIFQKATDFPSPEALEFPLSPDARHYYKSGRPLLQRYLPFWLAALAEQFVILVIPVLGLMYPLGRGLASLYGWGMQRKIYLLYGELHFLESELGKLGGQAAPKELLERIKHLEEKANRVKVSSNYIPMLYSLKENIAYVRGRAKA